MENEMRRNKDERKKSKKEKERKKGTKRKTIQKEKRREKEDFPTFEWSKFDGSRTKDGACRHLRVDTKKLEFRQTPRGRIFSYLV